MEISFKDISRIIKKNIALVLVIAMLFAVCSFFITKFFIQKTYTSSVKLYVSVNYEGSSGNDDLSIYNYTSKLVATYI
jgi:capsular polysaccharide biosynthesis protein